MSAVSARNQTKRGAKMRTLMAVFFLGALLGGCAPSQPIVVQSPPVYVYNTASTGGSSADEGRGGVYRSEKRWGCQEGRPRDPIVIEDLVGCIIKAVGDDGKQQPPKPPQPPSARQAIESFLWLHGKTIGVEYNTSKCGRTSWTPNFEERIKTTVEGGLERRGGVTSTKPTSDFSVLVCLSNYDAGETRDYEGHYVHGYRAHTTIIIVDNAKSAVAARGEGDEFYYPNVRGCPSCKVSDADGFLAAALRMMQNLYSTPTYANAKPAASTSGSGGVERATN